MVQKRACNFIDMEQKRAPELLSCYAKTQGEGMHDTEIDDGDISLLCDIGSGMNGPVDSSKLARVIGLIATGLVKREPEAGGSRLRLTEKGQDVLAERGVGINES